MNKVSLHPHHYRDAVCTHMFSENCCIINSNDNFVTCSTSQTEMGWGAVSGEDFHTGFLALISHVLLPSSPDSVTRLGDVMDGLVWVIHVSVVTSNGGL